MSESSQTIARAYWEVPVNRCAPDQISTSPMTQASTPNKMNRLIRLVIHTNSNPVAQVLEGAGKEI
jgi:hypothetical protein